MFKTKKNKCIVRYFASMQHRDKKVISALV